MKEDIMNSIYTVCLFKGSNNTKYLAFSFAIFCFKGKKFLYQYITRKSWWMLKMQNARCMTQCAFVHF